MSCTLRIHTLLTLLTSYTSESI